MDVALVVSNCGPKPLRLSFDTAQRFDVAILDSSGTEVWRLSEGRDYPRESDTVIVRDRWVVREPVRLTDRRGEALPDGSYRLRAVLTAQPHASAETTFEVQSVQ